MIVNAKSIFKDKKGKDMNAKSIAIQISKYVHMMPSYNPDTRCYEGKPFKVTRSRPTMDGHKITITVSGKSFDLDIKERAGELMLSDFINSVSDEGWDK
jgi:hypothetical protein